MFSPEAQQRILKGAAEKLVRLAEVEGELQNPGLAPNRMRDLGKELRDLRRVKELADDYQRILAHLAESQHVAADPASGDEFKALAREEAAALEGERDRRMIQLEEALIKKDPLLAKNAIIEIRAGTGGVEASLFAGEIFRMYTKYAASRGFKTEILSGSTTEAGGMREIIFSVLGEGVFGRFKFESGVHRVQRVPVTEASGRVHTSAITVAVLPEAEEIELNIKPEELKYDVFRSGGPGGQSVNTTDSAVRVTHVPSGLVVKCQDEKSQLKNKAKALKILSARLLDLYQKEATDKMSKTRKAQIGTGDRSEKIRTYNFPERRVTDHRIGLTIHNLDRIMEGEIDEIVNALIEAEKNIESK